MIIFILFEITIFSFDHVYYNWQWIILFWLHCLYIMKVMSQRRVILCIFLYEYLKSNNKPLTVGSLRVFLLFAGPFGQQQIFS